MKKKILLLLLLLLSISEVKAYSFSIPWINTSDPGSSNYDPNYDPYTYIKRYEMKDQQDASYKYLCSYKYYTYHTKNIVMNIYDETGKLLNPDRLVPSNLKFTAGTAIKLDVNEERRVHWNISDIAVERQTYRCYSSPARKRCLYKTDNTFIGCSNIIVDWSKKKTDSNSATTPCKTRDVFSYSTRHNWEDGTKYTIWKYYTHYEAESITEPEPTTRHKGACENESKTKVESIINNNKARSSTYEVQYSDGNKINGGIDVTETGDTKKDNKCEKITVTALTSPNGGLLHCSFSYNLGKTCMNTITAEVRYIKSDSSQTCRTEKGEIEVTNNSNKIKTNYFIPLDAKNGDTFKLLIDKNKGYDDPLLKEQCSYVRNHYSDWQNLIVGHDGESQLTDSNFRKRNDGTYEYIGVNNMSNTKKCYLKTSIVFPIEQKFYGQTTSYQSLKGYNIFFRQIDINNPFPNSISSTSIWHGLYNALNKKVNTGNGEVKLSSFDNITYRAVISNQNADKIRKFNESTSYTQWVKEYGKQNGMNADGTSNFIQNNSTIFVNRSSKSSFYKLGCGPANKDWSGCS